MVRMIGSQDKTFWVSHFALMSWMECMAAFVVIALPLLPKFAKSVMDAWRNKNPKEPGNCNASFQLTGTKGTNKISTMQAQPTSNASECDLTANETEHDFETSENVSRAPSRATGVSMV